MRSHGLFIAVAIVSAFLVLSAPGRAAEPPHHVVADQEVQARIDRQISQTDTDHEAIRTLLRNPQVRRIAGKFPVHRLVPLLFGITLLIWSRKTLFMGIVLFFVGLPMAIAAVTEFGQERWVLWRRGAAPAGPSTARTTARPGAEASRVRPRPSHVEPRARV